MNKRRIDFFENGRNEKHTNQLCTKSGPGVWAMLGSNRVKLGNIQILAYFLMRKTEKPYINPYPTRKSSEHVLKVVK